MVSPDGLTNKDAEGGEKETSLKFDGSLVLYNQQQQQQQQQQLCLNWFLDYLPAITCRASILSVPAVSGRSWKTTKVSKILLKPSRHCVPKARARHEIPITPTGTDPHAYMQH
ncbi:hypothetical protein ABBQ32_008037 [Trebouxia sp. C0010 RCD-2024]